MPYGARARLLRASLAVAVGLLGLLGLHYGHHHDALQGAL